MVGRKWLDKLEKHQPCSARAKTRNRDVRTVQKKHFRKVKNNVTQTPMAKNILDHLRDLLRILSGIGNGSPLWPFFGARVGHLPLRNTAGRGASTSLAELCLSNSGPRGAGVWQEITCHRQAWEGTSLVRGIPTTSSTPYPPCQSWGLRNYPEDPP